MLNGWNIMVQALACISNITKGVKCEEICNLQSGYYSGIGDYADCLHHPDRRKELRGAVMVVVSIKMGRPKIGRRCTNPACDNWFAPGKHNPEQRFCSSQCAIQARRAKSERITERFYEQPHKQLACAVIQQAVQKWKYDRNSKKDPDYVLWGFFRSRAFEFYCALAELEPEAVREALEIPDHLPTPDGNRERRGRKRGRDAKAVTQV